MIGRPTLRVILIPIDAAGVVVVCVVDVAASDWSRQVADDSVDGVVGQVVAGRHPVEPRPTADVVLGPVTEELGQFEAVLEFGGILRRETDECLITKCDFVPL